jgi:long-chain acyl-CoA synthetase
MKDLIKLHEIISAGRAALDEVSSKSLFKELAGTIENYSKAEQSESFLTDFNELLVRLNSARFGRDVAAYLDTVRFFNLGNCLIDDLKSENENKNHFVSITHEYLDLFRHPEFIKKIYGQRQWDKLILDLVILSNYNFRILFNQRVRDYSSKPLFRLIKHNNTKQFSWDEINDIVIHYQKVLSHELQNHNNSEIKVAFILENSLEMCCLDLACLTSGIVNVMIPANSVSQHIEFILNQTTATLVFISDEKQLIKLKSVYNSLNAKPRVILLRGSSIEPWVTSFADFLSQSVSKVDSNFSSNVEDLATIMYTSGTTGEPKGIMFSYKNIVYKRFCRAMAIPEIGDSDSFLAYLPLFHTFGRYLEMTGAVFWGMEYNFMENPSLEAMLSNMQQVKPSVFISIPKKWIQLYDHISSKVNIEVGDDETIKQTIEEATGGNLRWGLSAAGFLSPDIFRFFQRNNIELMSGFGMTEATGGITMTPPNEYRENSLGRALPGIEIKTAEDGELLVKGNYVMMNYFGQDKSTVFDEDDWLPTGDVMREDSDGFIEIIDRKKEIYKNIKGETIAPQKIENYFRDFENIKQVFLVGDHRAFNTLLIYPNYEMEEIVISKMDEEKRHEYFSSQVVTVNKFLAPFERIVDFRIIDRAFSLDYGELTPKGTYKRREIEKNFAEIIETMYKKNYTELVDGKLTVRLPNWFLREKGCLSTDVIFGDNLIKIPKTDSRITVKQVSDNQCLIGDIIYSIESGRIDFQQLLINPSLWLGNNELYNFSGRSIIQWHKPFTKPTSVHFSKASGDIDNLVIDSATINSMIEKNEISLESLHIAILALRSMDYSDKGLRLLLNHLNTKENIYLAILAELLSRPSFSVNSDTQASMLAIAVNYSLSANLTNVISSYLNYDSQILNSDCIKSIIEQSKKPDKLESFIEIIQMHYEKYLVEQKIEDTSLPMLFELIKQYGIKHPSIYERIRQILVTYQLKIDHKDLSVLAANARTELRIGFRAWLGQNQIVAVDNETGEEYDWNDVIVFEEGIDENDKNRMHDSIVNTPVLREAIFLISKGKVVHLNSLLPRGIWISLLNRFHNKSVYRISIQTRFQGSFELVINLNHSRDKDEILEEVNLLILAGSRKYVTELVEDFGGYWDENDLWTIKYIPGTAVSKFMQRESRKMNEAVQERLYQIWPFFVWNASAAYFNFWRLTSYKKILSDASLDNFIIPSHDYQTGTKIVSMSYSQAFISHVELFRNFYSQFVEAGFNKYKFLERDRIWSFIFAGVINTEGEKNGIQILKDFILNYNQAGLSKISIILKYCFLNSYQP